MFAMTVQHLVKSEWRVSAGTLSFSCSETGQLVTSPLPDHDGVGKVVHGMNTGTSNITQDFFTAIIPSSSTA